MMLASQLKTAAAWVALLAVVLGSGARASAATGAMTCKVCKVEEGDACLQSIVNDPSTCFTIPDAKCTAASQLTTDPKSALGDPFPVTCDVTKKLLTVGANADNLKSLAGKPVTASVDDLRLTATVAELPVTDDTNGSSDRTGTTPTNKGKGKGSQDSPAEDGSAKPEAQVEPIDISPLPPPPLAPDHPWLNPDRTPGVRYIFVYENLAVDPRSDAFSTETDRVVVRFIARNALLCRYYAASDDKNEYKSSIGRVGGTDGLKGLLQNFKLNGDDLRKSAAPTATSCGYLLYPSLETGRFRLIATGGPDGLGGNGYSYIDFTFGPFTSDQLVFHLFRHDRQFKGNDMEGQVKIANHQRYVGWADLVVVGTMLAEPNHVISVNRQNGSELTRIGVSDEREQVDLVAQIKFFMTCTGEGNHRLQPQDLNVAGACLGLGSGFSLTHPTQRFYPLGLNVTLGRYLSLNLLSVMERSKRLAGGYSSGDLFSGAAADVPTHERVVFGAGLGIGVDPTLVGDLVGQIIKAGF